MANKIMQDENPVYFRLGYEESLKSKRDILSLEMSLLNIIKIMRRYQSARIRELQTKTKVCKAIKELGKKIRETNSIFPSLKISQKTEKREARKKRALIPEEKVDEDLETQLRDIQEKLKSIGG